MNKDKKVTAQDVQEALRNTDNKQIEKFSKGIERDMFKFGDTLSNLNNKGAELRIGIDRVAQLLLFAEQTKEVKSLISELDAISGRLLKDFNTSLMSMQVNYSKYILPRLDGLGPKAVKLANTDLKNQKG